ncbi:MAG: hypothetical protein ASARMPREDX12_000721 [Alectoria sarmentosa]|nr:MAG: hypothetical protein ASARMPREDX12_000721 [Alectoria sarmentosa]
MYLPNELVVAIMESLGRHDLKSARLVCKTWCSCASSFLFDKIYVAPNKIDLEVFDAITHDPILSKCVRQLVYDGSEFMPDLTRGSYVRDLWTQTATMFDMRNFISDSRDSQIKDWTYDVARQEISLKDAVAKWRNRDIINRGYKKYREHSFYQQKALQNGDFVESLVQGLSRLVFLESVTLEGGWPYSVQTSLCETHLGTPLARGWDTFYLRPRRWSWKFEEIDSEEWPNEWPTGGRHYWIISAALVRAQRHIDEFVIGKNYTSGICAEVFERNDLVQPNALGSDIAACSGLKRLRLRLASRHTGSALGICENIQGLPKLLGAMHSLMFLDLDLSYNSPYYADLWRYNDVFPQVMTWNYLEAMELDNLASSATDLLRLLLIQMPNLKKIRLGTVKLRKGRWESVIECLKQFNHFTTFEIYMESILYYCGVYLLGCDNDDISEYIMHGGRHPCL